MAGYETTRVQLPHGRPFRALVCSDSHGHTDMLRRMRRSAGDVDAVLHLGDVAADARVFEDALVLSVSGNCDIASAAPYHRMLVVGQWRIWLTHGHLYRVKHDLRELYAAAAEAGCHMALYGHTHRRGMDNPGIPLVNPGSAFTPHPPSYGLLRADANGLEFDMMDME